jgi:signal transduction histidine kinase
VEDNGPGVPSADRERIFDPFFTTRSAEGFSGLGLAVSERLVRSMGGSIAVEALDPQGSRFVVSLPTPSPSLPVPEGKQGTGEPCPT